MSSTITINELQNVEAVAMKYTAHNLGFNIRPRKAQVLEKEGNLKVPLQAIIPRRVTKRGRESKVFVYRLEDVGYLLYKKIDKTYKLVSGVSAVDIDDEITQRFSKLTESVEREILKEGRKNWGKLSWIKTFLNPVYTMVEALVTSPEPISIDAIHEENKWKYAKLLVKENYAEVEGERPKYLVKTNKLTIKSETVYKEGGSNHIVAEQVAGIVFANRYNEIKTELSINMPTAYVETTKVYYIDALRYGENIPIHETDLFSEYQKINARIFKPQLSMMRFRWLLSELSTVNMLEKHGRYVNGKERFFDKLMEYRDEVLKGAIEAPSVVGM